MHGMDNIKKYETFYFYIIYDLIYVRIYSITFFHFSLALCQGQQYNYNSVLLNLEL
jgi:hypothetical protein